MACNYPICTNLLGAMDSLWHHHFILLHPLDTISVPEPVSSDSFTSSSSSSITEQGDSVLSDESPFTKQSIDSESEEREKIIAQVLKQTRPSRLNRIKTRSHPSSPTAKLVSRTKKYSGSVMRLQKTMSCKSLCELEVEEVKGFMDLGFRFNSQNLSPRMMSVLPGLQRLGGPGILQKQEKAGDGNGNRGVYRKPYLSEAWLIRRPDSPLLNLKIPRNSEAADMKKHLKYWARAVASVVQES